MPPVLLDQSVYDRDRHRATIRSLLGEDLWFKKQKEQGQPVPRKNFYGPGLVAAIKDGRHEMADRVMQAFVRYWPRSRGEGWPQWNDYGILREWSSRITTVSQFSQFGSETRTHLTAPSIWLQHLFLRRSVLPSYKNEEVFDCVRLDIDVQIGGVTYDLYRLQRNDLVRVFAPWVAAIENLRRTVGHFEVEWMLSGHRGLWLSVFFDTGGGRREAEGIREAIIRAVQGMHTEQEGKPIITVGDLTYSIDLGNLGDDPCRVPWSMHQDTQNVSVNIDPHTGDLDVLQFVETPYNEGSLSEFSEWFPACWDEPVRRETDASGRARKPKARPGGGVDVDWDDEPYARGKGPVGSPPGTIHRWWSWQDILAEADGDRRFTDWRDLVERDAPDERKRKMIVMSGNLMNVARAMKYQLGQVDWESMIAEYEAAYVGRDFSKGGTIRHWVDDLRRDTRDGATLTPFKPSLTPSDVERCRQFAQSLTKVQKRQREDIFHLLLVLRYLSVGRDLFEADLDFLARRAGINRFPRREEQHEAEFDPDDPRFFDAETGERLQVRAYPSSNKAGKRLKRLLSHICDLEEGRVAASGLHPFWLKEKGSNRKDHPRVREQKRAVGGLWVAVRSHPFWSGSGA